VKGWIHCVYTAEDSIVFGGNFLNSYNVRLQIICSRIEEECGIPFSERFPFFRELHWYTAMGLVMQLRSMFIALIDGFVKCYLDPLTQFSILELKNFIQLGKYLRKQLETEFKKPVQKMIFITSEGQETDPFRDWRELIFELLCLLDIRTMGMLERTELISYIPGSDKSKLIYLWERKYANYQHLGFVPKQQEKNSMMKGECRYCVNAYHQSL
jgi:hypothetical protein